MKPALPDMTTPRIVRADYCQRRCLLTATLILNIVAQLL